MNAQVNFNAKLPTFSHKGTLSRIPRSHKLSNNQKMITFPIQLEDGQWCRIAVYDKALIANAQDLRPNTVVSVSGVVKKDIWVNKSGVQCSANVFIAQMINKI